MGQIANTKVCCGQHSQWFSREHCDRLPILRYVVVSTVSGAVGSIVGQVANIKVYGGQRSQRCSREHCGTDCQY